MTIEFNCSEVLKSDDMWGGIAFEFSAPLFPWDEEPGQCVRDLIGTIMGRYSEDKEELDSDVGVVTCSVVLTTAVRRSGFEISEAFSVSDLYDYYPRLYTPLGRLQRYLRPADRCSDVVIIESLEIDAKYAGAGLAPRVIESVRRHFPPATVFATRRSKLPVADIEWMQLGFRCCPGDSDYIYSIAPGYRH